MNPEQFAKNTIQRLAVIAGQIIGDGLLYSLPEMSIADYVTYFDHERIPEELEYLARCLNVTPEYRATESAAAYIAEQEAKRAEMLEMLDMLREWYTEGLLSADDYQRLTTPQNYTGEHKQKLSEQVAHFIPRELGVGHKGHVYYLIGENADSTIWLRYENGHWIRDDDPYGKNG